jgi:hypothetical protein
MKLSNIEIRMLRHAVRIGLEDGSLCCGRSDEELAHSLVKKLDKALDAAHKPERREDE